MPLTKKAINYYSMEYHNVLSEEFSIILNNNNDNEKIIYKTYINSIKTINYKNEKIMKKPSFDFNSYGVYTYLYVTVFYTRKISRNFKIQNN